MTGIDSNADDLLTKADTDLKDDLRLTHYEAMREMYEQKRDYYQLLMDTTDKMILDIQKKKVGHV